MTDAAAWDERYASAELVWGAEPNRFLPPEVAGLRPGRGVDLACGEGRNAIWLARQGWTMTGVDFSEVGISKARRLAAHAGVTVDLVVDDVPSRCTVGWATTSPSTAWYAPAGPRTTRAGMTSPAGRLGALWRSIRP